MRSENLSCIRSIIAALFLAMWGGLGSVYAVEQMTAGAARFEITPEVRLSNWITHKPYGEVLDPIFVRAVVLAQGTNRVALVSWELLYAMEGVVAKTRQAIARETGILEGNILICATHNHSAPWPVLGDPLTKAEQKVLESFLTDPLYPAWTDQLIKLTTQAAKEADSEKRPATMAIGRAYAGELVFNRRPVKPDGSVQSVSTPKDPFVLPPGLRFGPVDPALTVLVLRSQEQKVIATLFNLACHAVSVYPSYDGISGDWPGSASAELQKALGGEALFLQGCAGDIVPARRGVLERDHMAKVVADRASAAAGQAQVLALTNEFRVRRAVLKAPAAEVPRREMKRDYLSPEVQVISCGPLAIVALPGEPFTGLAQAIQARSPFPHTVVVGYANGYGVQYVGLPGDKARGGYETGSRNLGTDECGQLLIDAAVRLLNEQVP